MDVIGEYRDRLINGAELIIVNEGSPLEFHTSNKGNWFTMLEIYRQCQKEIDALGYTKNELQIAAATAIFDAVVEK
jgi:hypothetical protein